MLRQQSYHQSWPCQLYHAR